MVDKDDVGQCLCCVLKTFFGGIGCCCLGALEFACSICGLFIGVVLICVLVPAYGVVYPVRATVRDASVAHLALAGANGTALAYDLSLTVALRNRNWAMRAEPSAPLVAELLFAGRRLEGATLAEDVSGASSIDPHREEEFRMRAVSSTKGLEVSPGACGWEQEDGREVPAEVAGGATAGGGHARPALDVHGVRQINFVHVTGKFSIPSKLLR
ncbi:hypothetical protein HU200_025893 [Digitaria exilis]|uniref:Late embryogenesis abundant protein LEA-2 subgroup domain-containing protein n=1 Tax=Digitaria exilis TaxID=1010633 RepID=A0A835BWP0_9POAL|nr:hypothetical protein HU200_025893 [Digitaria exilis]